jgi:hypothetical protein
MNPIIPIFFALTTAVLLVLFGYRLHGRTETATAEHPEPAAVSAWLSREEAVDQLRALRAELELDGQYGRIEAFLLFDVASYLGLDEAEIQSVVGACWVGFICDPADLDLEPGES